MNIAHYVRIEVFALNEEKEDVKNTIIAMLPESAKEAVQQGKLSIQEEAMKAKREEESDITIFRVSMEKKRHVREFLEKLFSALRDENLKDKLCKRVDEHCKCYVRLDKQSLLKGELKLTYSGECFHIKFPLVAYPARKEKGEKAICDFVDGM